jgi:integrase
MGLLSPLPDTDEHVIVLPMLTPSHAIDLYLGDLARKSRSPDGSTAAKYRTVLYKFADQLEAAGPVDVSKITPDDCRRFLDRYLRCAPNTQAYTYSVLNSFLTWLRKQKRHRENPLEYVDRPRRVKPEDLDVVTIQTSDVPVLFQAAEGWTELLAIGMLAYMGPRRRAASSRRLRHYDRRHGTILFEEKGGKMIAKPVPTQFRQMLDAAIDAGAIVKPDDYLIPPRGPLTRSGDRDTGFLYQVVTRVAERAGLRCHVHALRAAFATCYLEQNTHREAALALQLLMGHESFQTTQIYIRKLDRKVRMETVRDLDWSPAAVANPDTKSGLADAEPLPETPVVER